MTALPEPRPEIRLVLPPALPCDLPEAELLAWLRGALPGGFVHLAERDTDSDGGLRVFLLPDLVAHVARGLELGATLPDLVAEWAALARRTAAAGLEGFVLSPSDLARDPGAVAQALAQWCPAAEGPVELPVLAMTSPEDALVSALVAAFLAADPAVALPGHFRPRAPDAADLTAAAARLGADRAALIREAAARREAAGWLEALRRTLWAEADRAAQAEARTRALESRQAEVSRAAVPAPALTERLAHLEAMLAERDAYIQKVHHSKSWTVTAPLRRFSRLLRRG